MYSLKCLFIIETFKKFNLEILTRIVQKNGLQKVLLLFTLNNSLPHQSYKQMKQF